MFSIASILGWIGMIMLAISFYFISNGKLKAISFPYQIIQFIGCVFIALDSLSKGAFPAMALQIFCMCIAIKTMSSIINKKTKELRDLS